MENHEWELEVDFAEKLIKKFDVSQKGTHMGVIYFGTYAFQQIDLNELDGSSSYLISEKMKDLKTRFVGDRYHNKTRTDLALRMADEMFKQTPKTRKKPKTLVVVTDGISSYGMNYLLQPIKNLKGSHVTIMTVGVGLNRLSGIWRLEAEKELKYMASKDDLYFQIGKFEKLADAIKDLREYICSGT